MTTNIDVTVNDCAEKIQERDEELDYVKQSA